MKGPCMTIQWALVAGLLAANSLVHAQSPAKPTALESTSVPRLTLAAGKSMIYGPTDPIRRVSIGDPEVADIITLEHREFYLLGKKPGTTNLIMWPERGGPPRVIDITVETDTTRLQERFREWMPDEKDLRVSSSGGAVILSGQLRDAARVAQALQITEQVTGNQKIINLLSALVIPQVLLEVKVAEVSRTLTDRLGVRVDTSTSGVRSMRVLTDFLTGASGVVRAAGNGAAITLDAEIGKGLIKILAEPSILALSGQEGSFLAGGKVFIPVPQYSAAGSVQVAMQEREYGVGLKFLPRVLPGGMIQLQVTPEVSELTGSGTTVSNGQINSVLPTFTTRRTSTTVMLQDGQSFAIGGLTKNSLNSTGSQFPGLGDIPILGALFRSTTFQNDLSELVFVVTVRLVTPASMQPALPTDRVETATRAQRFGQGLLEQATPSTPAIAPTTRSP